MKSNPKHIVFAVLIGLAVVVLWMVMENTRGQAKKVTYSHFLQQVRAGNVAEVVILANGSAPSQTTCGLKDGNVVRTVLPSDYREAIAVMEEKLVNIEIQDSSSGWLHLLAKAAPFLLLLAFWVFMMQRMQKGPRSGSLG